MPDLSHAVRVPVAFRSGPYDERFGPDGDSIARTRAGASLRDLEAEKARVGLPAFLT